jgi:peptide/nickel transport system permease protein
MSQAVATGDLAPSPAARPRRRFRVRAAPTLGLLILALLLVCAIVPQWVAPYAPLKFDYRATLRPPSAAHWFGTDNFGRSLWSRVIWGAQLSVVMGLSVAVLNAVFGTLIGALAGYFRRVDNVLMRFNDALMAFPAILLAIAVTAVLGPSTANVVIALAIVYIPRTARIVRASVIVLREMEYVQAVVAAGGGHWRILRRHILPNAMAPLIVQLSFLFAYTVLSEATLSFLGLGAVPPTPTWGNIMAEGRQYMTDAPWIIGIPGAALMITVLGLNLLGDGLRDVLDPRLRIQQ